MLATQLVAIVSVFPAPFTFGEIIHVPAEAPTIQACIDAAVSGQDECIVAPGTYNELINFLGKAITLRSSDGADITTIDGTGIAGSVVTCVSGEGPNTVLDGFTITGGDGSGMYNFDCSPTVTNCTFSRNTGFQGGGIYNISAHPTLTNCTFSGNTPAYGGGVFNERSSPIVTDCAFIENLAFWDGGGMFNQNGSNPTVTRCTFTRNSATYRDGGGMYNHASSATTTHCTFSGNTAAYGEGGGMYNSGGNPTVTGCTFSGNAALRGGGMSNRGGSILNITSCTFSRNTATYGGGMYIAQIGGTTVTHCILRNDPASEISDVGGSVIAFSDLRGGLPLGAIDGGGNVDLDPMFIRAPSPGADETWNGVDDDYGDLRVQPGSPCINAGDPDFVPTEGETDLDGHARVLCYQVDMGAYESGIADFDCDQQVGLTDFAAWDSCTLGPDGGPYGNGCEAFDANLDLDVDLRDFATFQNSLTAP